MLGKIPLACVLTVTSAAAIAIATTSANSVSPAGNQMSFMAPRRVCRATGNGPEDDTDVGQIVSRVLAFTKVRNTTALRISYTDNFRVLGEDLPAAGRWEIRVDGATCPSGALIYDFVVDTVDQDDHASGTVVGYCEGLPPGAHTIGIWVGDVTPHPAADRHTGWQSSRWVLEVEEVEIQCP